MQVFICASLARQINGEYCFLMIDKCFSSRQVAEAFYKDKPLQESITVQNVPCLMERSILEAELE